MSGGPSLNRLREDWWVFEKKLKVQGRTGGFSKRLLRFKGGLAGFRKTLKFKEALVVFRKKQRASSPLANP